MLATRAPAKVNLTLHVFGRRPDGYHALESLVAFAGTGDDLSLEPGALSLSVSGPTASAAGGEADNLVLKAARALARRVPGLRTGAFHLTKLDGQDLQEMAVGVDGSGPPSIGRAHQATGYVESNGALTRSSPGGGVDRHHPGCVQDATGQGR